MLRSLLMPRLSREWMHELSQWSNLDTLLTRQPAFLCACTARIWR